MRVELGAGEPGRRRRRHRGGRALRRAALHLDPDQRGPGVVEPRLGLGGAGEQALGRRVVAAPRRLPAARQQQVPGAAGDASEPGLGRAGLGGAPRAAVGLGQSGQLGRAVGGLAHRALVERQRLGLAAQQVERHRLVVAQAGALDARGAALPEPDRARALDAARALERLERAVGAVLLEPARAEVEGQAPLVLGAAQARRRQHHDREPGAQRQRRTQARTQVAAPDGAPDLVERQCREQDQRRQQLVAVAVGDEERHHREGQEQHPADQEPLGGTAPSGEQRAGERQCPHQRERDRDRQAERPGQRRVLVGVLDLGVLAPAPHHAELGEREPHRPTGVRGRPGAGAREPPRRALDRAQVEPRGLADVLAAVAAASAVLGPARRPLGAGDGAEAAAGLGVVAGIDVEAQVVGERNPLARERRVAHRGRRDDQDEPGGECCEPRPGARCRGRGSRAAAHHQPGGEQQQGRGRASLGQQPDQGAEQRDGERAPRGALAHHQPQQQRAQEEQQRFHQHQAVEEHRHRVDRDQRSHREPDRGPGQAPRGVGQQHRGRGTPHRLHRQHPRRRVGAQRAQAGQHVGVERAHEERILPHRPVLEQIARPAPVDLRVLGQAPAQRGGGEAAEVGEAPDQRHREQREQRERPATRRRRARERAPRASRGHGAAAGARATAPRGRGGSARSSPRHRARPGCAGRPRPRTPGRSRSPPRRAARARCGPRAPPRPSSRRRRASTPRTRCGSARRAAPAARPRARRAACSRCRRSPRSGPRSAPSAPPAGRRARPPRARCRRRSRPGRSGRAPPAP